MSIISPAPWAFCRSISSMTELPVCSNGREIAGGNLGSTYSTGSLMTGLNDPGIVPNPNSRRGPKTSFKCCCCATDAGTPGFDEDVSRPAKNSAEPTYCVESRGSTLNRFRPMYAAISAAKPAASGSFFRNANSIPFGYFSSANLRSAFAISGFTARGRACSYKAIISSFWKRITDSSISWTRSPAWNTPASPNNSRNIPTMTAHFAASYQMDFFHSSESENSPNRPSTTNTADTSNNRSDMRSQDLASDADKELKSEIFKAHHIAMISNITVAIALAIFLMLTAIRDLISHFRKH